MNRHKSTCNGGAGYWGGTRHLSTRQGDTTVPSWHRSEISISQFQIGNDIGLFQQLYPSIIKIHTCFNNLQLDL